MTVPPFLRGVRGLTGVGFLQLGFMRDLEDKEGK